MFVKKKVFCGLLALSLFSNAFAILPSNAGFFDNVLNTAKDAIGIGRGVKDKVDNVKDRAENAKNKAEQVIGGGEKKPDRSTSSSNDTVTLNKPVKSNSPNDAVVLNKPFKTNSALENQNINYPLINKIPNNTLNKQNIITGSQGSNSPSVNGGNSDNLYSPANSVSNNSPISLPGKIPNKQNIITGSQANNFPNSGNSDNLYSSGSQTIPRINIPNISPNQRELGNTIPNQTTNRIPNINIPNITPNQGQVTGGGNSIPSFDLKNPESIIAECQNRANSGMFNNRPCFLPNSPEEEIVKRFYEGKEYPTVTAMKRQQQDLVNKTNQSCQEHKETCDFVSAQMKKECESSKDKDNNPLCKESFISGSEVSLNKPSCAEGGAWGSDTEINCKIKDGGAGFGSDYLSKGSSKSLSPEVLNYADSQKEGSFFKIYNDINKLLDARSDLVNAYHQASGFVDQPIEYSRRRLTGHILNATGNSFRGAFSSALGVSPSVVAGLLSAGNTLVCNDGSVGQAALTGAIAAETGVIPFSTDCGRDDDYDRFRNEINNNININSLVPSVGSGPQLPNNIQQPTTTVYGPQLPSNIQQPRTTVYGPQPNNPPTAIGSALFSQVLPDGCRETTETFPDGRKVVTKDCTDKKSSKPSQQVNPFKRKVMPNGDIVFLRKDTGAVVSVNKASNN